MARAGFVRLAVLALFVASTAAAQSPAGSRATPAQRPSAAAPDEAVLLTNGWALLAQGSVEDAYRKAAEILSRYPRSAPALSFAVEAAVARGGAANGLAQYEQWLGSRTFEEPAVLRRVATGVLQEAAAQRRDEAVRLAALKALAGDGQQAAVEALEASPLPANTRTLAALGNAAAVKDLTAQLEAGNADKARIVEAIGRSGRRSAASVVAAQASDPRDEVRAAVADALGSLEAESEIGALKSLLYDSSEFVRVHAARALFRMGDMSGLSLLQQLATGDAPSGRLVAAEAMSTSPDPGWLASVRDLTSSSEPDIRVQAARLLAPQDPETARRVLESASADSNIAIREMANRVLPDVLTDLTALRRLLHGDDPLSRLQAAARILELTR